MAELPDTAPMTAPMTAATAADASDIVALRDLLARWMVDSGIEQWLPGEYPVAQVAAEAESGEWFVWRTDTQPLTAAVRLIWRDPEFWGEYPPAGYVHGLMVAPAYRGRGFGSAILRFCAERTRDHGLDLQRLDAAATNQVLRKYYAAHGFSEVREAPLPPQFGGASGVVLFEKRLA